MIRYTPDANFVLKKWSTWLSIMSASLFSGVLAYDKLPRGVIESLPEWFDGAMGIAAVLSAMLVPIATSIQQKSIPVVDPTAMSYTGYPTYGQYYPHQSDEEMP